MWPQGKWNGADINNEKVLAHVYFIKLLYKLRCDTYTYQSKRDK